jgi:hypothetical protein
MKFLIVLLPMLTSCQSRRIMTLANGTTYEDWGHLAGNTVVAVKPDGTFVAYNKMNQPWQDLMQTIAAGLAAHEAADVGVAVSANRRITRLGAQRTTVERARLANELQRLKLATELEKFRLLHPETLPAALP